LMRFRREEGGRFAVEDFWSGFATAEREGDGEKQTKTGRGGKLNPKTFSFRIRFLYPPPSKKGGEERGREQKTLNDFAHKQEKGEATRRWGGGKEKGRRGGG